MFSKTKGKCFKSEIDRIIYKIFLQQVKTEEAMASSEHPWFFENDQIKSFTTNLPPGGKLEMHSHAPHLRLSLGRGHNKHTWPNQSTSEVIDQPGDYEWRDYLEHAVENLSKTDPIESLIVELKSRVALDKEPGPSRFYAETSQREISKLIHQNGQIRAYEILLGPDQGIKEVIPGTGILYFMLPGGKSVDLLDPTGQLKPLNGLYVPNIGQIHMIRNNTISEAKILVIEMFDPSSNLIDGSGNKSTGTSVRPSKSPPKQSRF